MFVFFFLIYLAAGKACLFAGRQHLSRHQKRLKSESGVSGESIASNRNHTCKGPEAGECEDQQGEVGPPGGSAGSSGTPTVPIEDT